MKKTFKGALAFAFCIVTVFATMIVASALGAPKAKVSSVTYNSVTLSWEKVSGADFYEVQRSTDGKNWTNLNKTVKSTSYKDSSSLTAGKTYKYRVRAVEDRFLISDVYSSWSSVVSGKPVPAKVTGLKVASRTHNSIKLTWTKVDGASGYEVQLYNGSAWKSYKKTTSNSLTASSLTLGKTYQFRVRAYRTVSGKAVYGNVSATVKSNPYLKAPTTFVLKGVTTSTLKLAWSSVSGAKGYEVYNTVTKKWTNVKTAQTLTVKSLKAGTKYGFIVRAYSGSYKGAKTETRYYFTTPAKSASIKETSSSASSVTFSWSAVTGAAGYQPAVKDPDTGKVTYLSTTTKTSATAKGLTSGKKYIILVRAYVKNSNVKDISATSYSSWASANIYTNPSAPSSLKVTKITGSSLSLVWAKPTGATSFEYYNPVSKKWVSTGSANTVTVSGLSAGTKYTFKVRAVLSSKKSADSKEYSFLTTPSKVTGLKSTAVTGSTLTVSWTAVKGATGYQVYIKKSSAWEKALSTTSTSGKITGLSGYTEYPVKVRAYVKNSNVKNISEYSFGSYSNESKYLTKIGKPSVTAASTSSDTITLNWKSLKGAVAYTVEKYDYQEKEWYVYDFNSKSWRLYENLTDNSVVTTTALTLADKGKATRSDIYRVIGIDKNGNVGTSNEVTGTTSDLKLTINDYNVKITLPQIEGISEYQVYLRYPDNMPKEIYQTSNRTFTLNLAPSSYQTIFVIGTGTLNGKQITSPVTSWFTFRTKDLKIVSSTSDSNYNASVNSQLLYLAQAINNTKAYQNKITVKNLSEISYSINYLKLEGLEIMQLFGIPNEANSAQEVSDMFKKIGKALGEDIDFPTQETEKLDATVTFENGKGSYDGKTINLNTFIEPTSNAEKTAYLYKGLTSQTAWKDGFESVKTTKNSDGSYTIKAVLKQEKTNTNFHSGFISSFNMSDFSGEGIEMNYFNVGSSTLNAKIDSEGYLKTYAANAPYSAKMTANLGVNMIMKLGGKTTFNYTFTR